MAQALLPVLLRSCIAAALSRQISVLQKSSRQAPHNEHLRKQGEGGRTRTRGPFTSFQLSTETLC